MSRLNYFKTQPKAHPLQVKGYLKRLGLESEEASLSFLRKIHRAHLLNIPFENLDIHYGRKIILDIDRIYKKVIESNRGGLCYELNSLFYNLLLNLGFDAYLTSAEIFEKNVWSHPFEHMVVLVQIDDSSYLCDVGFGQSFTTPKKITDDQPQLDYTNYYKFDLSPDDEWILKYSSDNSAYYSVYKFLEKPCELIEFLPRCNYHQESMDSKFKKSKVVIKLFREGWISLSDRKITKNLLGESEEKIILNEDEFHALLEEHFEINFQGLIDQQAN